MNRSVFLFCHQQQVMFELGAVRLGLQLRMRPGMGMEAVQPSQGFVSERAMESTQGVAQQDSGTEQHHYPPLTNHPQVAQKKPGTARWYHDTMKGLWG